MPPGRSELPSVTQVSVPASYCAPMMSVPLRVHLGPHDRRAAVEHEQRRTPRVGQRVAHAAARGRAADHLPAGRRLARDVDLVVAVAAVGPRRVAHAARIDGDGRIERRADAAGEPGPGRRARDLRPPAGVGRAERQRIHRERIVRAHRRHRIRRRRRQRRSALGSSPAPASIRLLAPSRSMIRSSSPSPNSRSLPPCPFEPVAAGAGLVQVGAEVAVEIVDRVVVGVVVSWPKSWS